MILGFAAFTSLEFARLGTAIALVATVVVAIGSETAFMFNKWEREIALKNDRHMV
ncbi:hypothetical protein HBH98_206250 [Parastagonospora nodorum]|nr:hypothetical protein HBH53_197950 [Parastagonospora nodorum]KAH3961037.1 hypothetical protein HBH51_187760 [Parastagonospora nodorum]KAH3966762.1 hypothetical protein HBH52_194220 [Parastagonospora nodorum]KAH3992743.1 hypothetical protein HBI10_213410 [Parastagonospora nodorum]KAH4029807.1 hypothetical protein HBI13_032720 [Parastagonospora nodorum]